MNRLQRELFDRVKWYRRHQSRTAALQATRKRDPRDNEETSPPDDEEIAFCSLWLAECFPLSALDDRDRSIERLSHRPQNASFANFAETLDSLRQRRTLPHNVSWSNLGVFAPAERGIFSATSMPVPQGVDHIRASLYTMQPSFSVVVAQFVLNDQPSQKVMNALQREYSSYLRKESRPGLIEPQNVERQKHDAIRAIRRRVYLGCSAWLGEHFPGAFNGGLLDGDFPRWEVWTTKAGLPFDESNRQPYMFAIGLGRARWAWESKKLPGLRLTEADDDASRLNRQMSHGLVLAGRLDDVFPDEKLETHGGNRPWMYANLLDDALPGAIAVWTLSHALSGYQSKLLLLRHSLTKVGATGTRESLRRLEAAEAEFTELSWNVVPLVSDLDPTGDTVKRIARFLDDVDFQQVSRSTSASDDSNHSWLKAWTEMILLTARRLDEMVKEVRELQSGIAQTLSVRANLGLQRRLLWLTIVLLVVAVVTLALTADPDNVERMWDFITRQDQGTPEAAW